jgi:ankyrin repeat protein
LILDLLESEAKVSVSSQVIMTASGILYRRFMLSKMTEVYLAAYFGLREAMITLLKNGYDPNVKDTYDQTPLWWAVRRGHEAVVKLLLAEDSVDPDSEDTKYGRAPLSWAAEEGHEAVVKLMLANLFLTSSANSSLVSTSGIPNSSQTTCTFPLLQNPSGQQTTSFPSFACRPSSIKLIGDMVPD